MSGRLRALAKFRNSHPGVLLGWQDLTKMADVAAAAPVPMGAARKRSHGNLFRLDALCTKALCSLDDCGCLADAAIEFVGTSQDNPRRTNMKKLALALTLAAVLSLSLAAQAQEGSSAASSETASKPDPAKVDQDVSLLRQDLRSGKKQLIAANLNLTDEEATKFWPVYDEYANEAAKLGDEKYALLKEYAEGYGKLSDDEALSLLKRSTALDEKIAQLRSKYVPLVNDVLPGTKTATFFQIDRRLSNLIDLQLAKEIPLVQDQK
jgi:hypothetical protein